MDLFSINLNCAFEKTAQYVYITGISITLTGKTVTKY